MKIALINGSPRGKNSTSLHLLDGLKVYISKIDSSKELEFLNFTWNNSNVSKDFENLLSCDTLIFSFPLYVDSIPSHLLRNLMSFESYIESSNSQKSLSVYVLVNNGFFDGKQNHLALDNIKHFCHHVNFKFKQGIGIGGGGMLLSVVNVPFGHGPKKSIGKALDSMAKNILEDDSSENLFVNPNIPGFAYKLLAEKMWRDTLKKNGLKSKDINTRVTFK